jgi:mycothiol synthase
MSQLRMEFRDFEAIPEIPLQEGYQLRHFREGDEAGLALVFAASGVGPTTAEDFRTSMVGASCFRPERTILIECGGEIVATASAWLNDSFPGVGYLHNVGVKPGHQGKKLGALVTLATLRAHQKEGFSAQVLETDDWREPAVRLYLKLGYTPLLVDASHEERWKALAAKLDCPDVLTAARKLY